jgi:hypothetical protein
MGNWRPRNRGNLYFLFFLVVLIHGYFIIISSLGFAKSKNGQIEYASTFLEAKASPSSFHITLSAALGEKKGSFRSKRSSSQHSSSGLMWNIADWRALPYPAQSSVSFLHCPFSFDRLRLHVPCAITCLGAKLASLDTNTDTDTDTEQRADEQIASTAENRLSGYAKQICVGGKWVAWGRFKPDSWYQDRKRARAHSLPRVWREKQSLEQHLESRRQFERQSRGRELAVNQACASLAAGLRALPATIPSSAGRCQTGVRARAAGQH